VTSRSALRLRGEREFPVPPLALPSATHDVQPEDVPRWSATALFWERVQAIRPDLELDLHTAHLVVEICRKLDGLPLAIELAAARVRHLPLPAVRDHLEDRLRFLVGGPLDLPMRQRTMRDTVAWSHGLLRNRDATLFRRLAAFSGGWNLTDIEAVCGSDDEVGDGLEGISTLVDQSLVVLDRNRPGARYDMLDVVREYAAQQLLEAGEAEQIARRHALHYLALAEEAEPNLVGPGQAQWFQRLDLDRGNLRRAMAWCIEHGEPVLALRFTVALWRFWRQLGEFVEGRRWSDAAIARSEGAPVSLQAKAVWATAALAFPQGDYQRMAELAERASQLAQMTDDPMDRRNALTTQGMVAMCEGRYADALEPFREGIVICRELGLSWPLATSYLNLGMALLHSGSPEQADATFQDGLRLYHQLGDEIFAARISNASAQAALARDDVERADGLGRAALSACMEHNEPQGIADGLEILAAVAAARSDAQRAATLSGAAAAVRERIASCPAPFELAIITRSTESVRRTTDEHRWQLAWEAGHTLSAEAAAAYALHPSGTR
jgi:predicted ATPase